jgi:hypothetical protein
MIFENDSEELQTRWAMLLRQLSMILQREDDDPKCISLSVSISREYDFCILIAIGGLPQFGYHCLITFTAESCETNAVTDTNDVVMIRYAKASYSC